MYLFFGFFKLIFNCCFNRLEAEDSEKGNLDRMGEMIGDLVMWRDVAKSSLWFGFGCLCFFSSFFTKGVTFR